MREGLTGKRWERYLQLQQSRPELFLQGEELEIITDHRVIADYESAPVKR